MKRSASSSKAASAERVGSVALSTAVDQGLSSASNALLVFVVAQMSSADRFGTIGLLITVLNVCMGFSRGSLGTPLLLTSNRKDPEIIAESRYAVAWSLCNGVIGGFLLIAVGTFFHHPWMGLAFAVATPVVLAQDVLRLTAIAMRQPHLAVAADTLWAASMLVIFVANLFGAHESAEFSVYVWTFSGLVSVGIFALRLGVAPRYGGILDWWRIDWPARLRFASVYALGQIGFVVVTVATVATAGSVAAAGIRGASTLFGPVATLLSALPAVFVPHAVRTGNSVGDQWRLMTKTSLATSLITVLATAGLMAVPVRLGTAILGDSWSETYSVLSYIGISSAAICWIVGVSTVFQSQRASKAVFGINVVLVGLQLAATVIAGLVFASAVAIAVSLALSSLAVAIAGVLWLRRDIHLRRMRFSARFGSAIDVSEGVVIQ